MNEKKYRSEYWKRVYILQDYIEKNPTEIFTSEQLFNTKFVTEY